MENYTNVHRSWENVIMWKKKGKEETEMKLAITAARTAKASLLLRGEVHLFPDSDSGIDSQVYVTDVCFPSATVLPGHRHPNHIAS